MASIAEGRYTITSWEEETVQENEDGSKLTHATVTQSYSGDLNGESTVHYFMMHATDKSARFIGYESISCELGGKQGKFTVQHDGKFSIGVASSQFKVVSGSGRGGLMNISGQGKYSSDKSGEASYRFEYNADSSEDQVGA